MEPLLLPGVGSGRENRMPIFAIDTATARYGRERRAGCTRDFRTLEVEGPAEGGGRNHACLIFSAAVDPARTSPVGYVTEGTDGGLALVGWLPETAYPAYREVVAEGGPLQVHFEPRDRTSGYLRRIAIGRADAALVAAMGGCPVLERSEEPLRQEPAFAMPL
jgi:hypothetical protein